MDLPRLYGVDYDGDMCYLSENVINQKTYSQGVSGPDGKAWLEAIIIEIENLKRRDVAVEVK